MSLRPILSSLRRHVSATTVMVLQVAITCAILCNALFMVWQRVEAMRTPTGIQEDRLFVIESAPLVDPDDAAAFTQADLATLRAVPGVQNATAPTQLPLTNNSNGSGITTAADENAPRTNTVMYFADEGFMDTLGLRLLAGRGFRPDEYKTLRTETDFNTLTFESAIITRGLGEKLWPGENPLGKTYYMGTEMPIRVIGVVDHLLRPGNWNTPDTAQFSAIYPVRMPVTLGGQYAVRVRPGADRRKVMQACIAELKGVTPRRLFGNSRLYDEIRSHYYAQDKAMLWLLSVVALALLAVTAFGIVGLASFWVQQRTRQIGVRRALGATRRQILRYFQTENFLIVTGGVVLGMLLAFGINQLLMSKYELPRLPWMYLPVGALCLWALGQLAVLWPALRAAAIPPATATRSL